jgi:SPP1 gp7 family putative phage head morphogenesis protein
MPSAEEVYQDKQIGHGIYITRYSTGLTNRFVKELNDGMNEILSKYVAKDPKTKRGVLSTNQQVQTELRELYKDLKSKYTAEMREYINFELEYQIKNTDGIAGIELRNIDATDVTNIIKQTPIGKYETMAAWFKAADSSTYNTIASAINRGWDEGRSIDDIVKELRGTRKLNYTDGLLQTSKNNAKSFVRTSVKAMETQSQVELWEANSDIVKKYEWVSVLDGRTSIICAERDGNVYEVGKGPLPPAHPNCRSSVTPVFNKDAKQSDKARYSVSGKQPEQTTYRDFLSRQPAWFQKEVLGTARYEAFKKDKNIIDKFVTPAGGIYTVEELKNKGVL